MRFNPLILTITWMLVVATLNGTVLRPLAFAENCDIPLLTQTQIQQYAKKEHARALTETKGILQSAAFRIMRRKLNREILKQCQPIEKCTPELLGRIVQDQILILNESAELIGRKPKVLAGHALIIGAMISAGFASSFALGHLPDNAKWLSSLITPISAAVIWAMGATYLKRTQGYFEALGFRITSPESSKKSIASNELDAVYNQMQSTYTVPQQNARGLMNNFMGSMRTGLNSALILLSDGYSPRAQTILSSQLAEVLTFSSKFFQDIPLDDESIVTSIHLLVTDHIPNPEDRAELLEATLQKIDRVNPVVAKNSRVILEKWLNSRVF